MGVVQRTRTRSRSLHTTFFKVVDDTYLNDGMAIVARAFGVLMDVDEMLMLRIMPMVKVAEAALKKG